MGLREHENEVARLSRDNFNLRLRVYHLEERLSQPTTAAPNAGGVRPHAPAAAAAASAAAAAEVVDLRVSLDAARAEIDDKTELLVRARASLSRLKEQLEAERSRTADLVTREGEASRRLSEARVRVADLEGELHAVRSHVLELRGDLIAGLALASTSTSSSTGMLMGVRPEPISASVVSSKAAAVATESAGARLSDMAAESRRAAATLRQALETSAARTAQREAQLRQAQTDAAALRDELAASRAALEAVASRTRALHEEHTRALTVPSLGRPGPADSSTRTIASASSSVTLVMERSQRLERRCAELAEQLSAHEAAAAGREADLRSRVDSLTHQLVLAEGRAQAANTQSTDLASTVEGMSRRLAEAESAWAEAAHERGAVAAEHARLRSQLRQAQAEAEVAREEARELRRRAAVAAEDVTVASSGRAELLARRLARALARLRALRQSLRGGLLAPVLGRSHANSEASTMSMSDADMGRSRADEDPRRQRHSGRAIDGSRTPQRAEDGGENDTDADADDDEAEARDDVFMLRALGELPPITEWVRDEAERIGSRAATAMDAQRARCDALEARLVAAEAAVRDSAHLQQKLSVTRMQLVDVREELQLARESVAEYDASLQASARRVTSLEESNRLLALELQEKSSRLAATRGAITRDAADALDSCVDRLGLLTREAQRTVERVLELPAERRVAEVASLETLTTRVAELARDTLTVLRRLRSS